MADDSGHLILGAAFRLQAHETWMFVESLRKHYDGQVMLLVTSVDSQELVTYLRSRGVTPVFFDCPYWMVAHIQVARYIRYSEILRGCERAYDRILLTDVSDVLFQANPFATDLTGDLLCFLETAGRTIGQSACNSQWMQQIFGQGILEQLQDKTISCSGTTIGSHEAIIDYINRMLGHADPNLLAQLTQYRGHDQAIHNFLLYTGALPQAQLIPNGVHVYTVGGIPDSEIILGPQGTLLTPQRRLCPIVHQYNYRDKAAAAAHLKTIFPWYVVAPQESDATPPRDPP